MPGRWRRRSPLPFDPAKMSANTAVIDRTPAESDDAACGHGVKHDSFANGFASHSADSTTVFSAKREAQLKDAEAKYRGIFENAIEGIYQSTPDGRYVAVNIALARMYGYESPAEMMGQVSD